MFWSVCTLQKRNLNNFNFIYLLTKKDNFTNGKGSIIANENLPPMQIKANDIAKPKLK